MTFRSLTLPLALALCLPAALAAAAPTMTAASGKGEILTDDAGMTLYVFDKDANGRSACNGECATKWPPLAASADDKPTGDYAIIARDDGTLQWSYKGKPLYAWFKDAKPGDLTGDGVNGVWHLARP
ncbi:MAG: hypothetical protein H5U24_14060 [Thioclava marina]|uniref:COG4315 family predicted lipoprotein n=1 Tax=Thioclava marina TaxID=1915077 RepID=UPI0019B85921|nr:hypothetical protein [Thioclava marina]MBC7146508.1 hypothetical protein [Thioclava marina]